MADQAKWFKLWNSALDDPDLENLSIHEWFCWVRFGTYLKKHGRDGKMRLRAPATALVNLLRLPGFQEVIDMLKRFPNYLVEGAQNVTAKVTIESVTWNIKCSNWHKYQGDFSGDRVRKHRAHVTTKVTAQEEKRREVEENRKDSTPQTPQKVSASRFQRPTPQEVSTYAKSIDFDLEGQKFCDYYESKGWKVGNTPMKDWQAAVRTWHRKYREDNPNAPNGRKSATDYYALARRARGAQGLRKVGETTTRSLLAGIRSLSNISSEAGAGERGRDDKHANALAHIRGHNVETSTQD